MNKRQNQQVNQGCIMPQRANGVAAAFSSYINLNTVALVYTRE